MEPKQKKDDARGGRSYVSVQPFDIDYTVLFLGTVSDPGGEAVLSVTLLEKLLHFAGSD